MAAIKRILVTTFAGVALAALVYSASPAILATLVIRPIAPTMSVQPKPLPEQVEELAKKYGEVASYASPKESATIEEKIRQLLEPLNLLKKSSDDPARASDALIEGQIVAVAKALITEIGKQNTAVTAKNKEITDKQKEIDTATTELAGITDEQAKKAKAAAIKSLQAQKQDLEKLQAPLSSKLSVHQDALKELQDDFFAGKTLDATSATAANCVIHAKSASLIADVKKLYTLTTSTVEPVVLQTPGAALDTGAYVARIKELQKQVETTQGQVILAGKVSEAFGNSKYNGENQFQTEASVLSKKAATVLKGLYDSGKYLFSKDEEQENIEGRLNKHGGQLSKKLATALNSDYDTIRELWEQGDALFRATDPFVDQLNATLKLGQPVQTIDRPASMAELSRLDLLAADWIEGSSDQTIVDQVRLFYYPNAMAILQSLRPREKYEVLNEATLDLQDEARNQNETLRTLEATVLQLNAERNDLQSQLVSIRDDIKRLTRDIQSKRSESDRLTNTIEGQDKRITAQDTQISKLQEQIAAANTAGNAAKAQTLTTQKESVERSQANLKEQKTETEKEKTAVNAEKTNLETERSKLTEKQGDTPAKLATVEKELSDKTKELRLKRAQIPNLATKEAEAFGDYVQNEPIYMARGTRKIGSAASRVRFIVYPRSKVIILRGPKADVSMVKDIIALFDRPAPQAKITLHALQVNGNDPRAISMAMSDVTKALRDAKANMMIVQDTLRNAIVAEVARCEQAARRLDPEESIGSGIRNRATVYSRGVRMALGLIELDPPTDREKTTEQLARLQTGHELKERNWQFCRVLGDLDELANMITVSSGEVFAAQQHKRDKKGALAAKIAMMRFRLVATRAAYLASKCMGRLQRFKAVASQLRVWLDSCEGEKFKRVFEKAYDIVRRGLDDPDLVASIFVDAYDGIVIPAEGGTYRPVKRERSPVTDVGKALIAGLQKLYTVLKTATSIDPKWRVGNRAYLYSITVPDPAKVTTLGEMLFVMSLIGKDSRERILHDFAEQLYFDAKLNSLTGSGYVRSDILNYAVATIAQFGNQARNEPEFANVNKLAPYPLAPRSVFGANPFSGTGSDSNWAIGTVLQTESGPEFDEASSNQLEILYGLRAKVRRNLAAELRRFANQLEVPPIVKLTPEEKEVITFAKSRLFLTDQINDDEPKHLKFLADRLEESESLSTATPRVAAADMMIKRFMETFETDFDKFFIDPMLNTIREATGRRGVSFGGYERKMILASNRLLARVEVSGTANVQVGEPQNILAESATLLSILNAAGQPGKAPVGGNGNAVGNSILDGTATALGASALKQTGANSLMSYGIIGSLVSSLLTIPEEGRGEIYSIGTGGSFKVTPIFNPSGQGLTFRLDYAQANVIQEPNGTTQLQSPKVDRHTVNTEVQITNLDIGEISSFESNYKLGRGEKTAGGVPILRDLFPSVPIIGWFTRSPKINAVRQHSLIFAQTAMYPTVGDIMDLLVQSPTGGRFRTSGAPDFSDPKDKKDG